MKRRHAGCVLLVLALSHCDLFSRQVTKVECLQNSDCLAGNVCYFSACLPFDGAPAKDITVTITPPASFQRQEQQVPLPADSRVTLAWKRPTRFIGRITDTLSSQSPKPNIPGNLTTQRRSAGSQPYSVRTSPEGVLFEVYLDPDDYDVFFIPNVFDRFAPISLGVWTVGADDQLAYNQNYPTLVSTFVGRLGTTPDNLTMPSISDASVYATIDGSNLSSTLAATGDDGSFRFVLAQTVGTMTLHIAPSGANPFVPEINLSGYPIHGVSDLGTVFIGEIGNPLFVDGTAKGVDGAALANATITADASVGLGTYRASTLADGDGHFSLQIVRTTQPLQYRVRARPTAESGYAASEVTYDVPLSGAAAALAITCGERTTTTGVVLDATSTPVKSADLTARPKDETRFAVLHTITGADGRFTIDFDATDYTLEVKPPAGSHLVRTRIDVTGGDAAPVFVTLKKGALVGGEISDPQKHVFGGAQLGFYQQIDDKPVLVGETLVDDNNHFSISLPTE